MELDEQVFRDDAFDAYAWLEEAVIDRNGHVPELTALVPQLALLSQSLTASIHGTLHQLTLAGPQLQAQLDAMQRATAPLAQQLDSVVSSAGSSSSSSSVSASALRRKDNEEQDLQYLLELHEAKERLQSCSKALVEAARWEKNVRACAASIDAIAASDHDDVGEQNPTKLSLADRVREMHKSLAILKDMPGADDRARTLERLSSQIEHSIKPKLDEYLQANPLPVASVQFCRAVLTSIGRDDHVLQTYCRCRPAPIHRLWYSYNSSASSFSSWLGESFYAEVLRMVQREAEHAGEIFGAADAPLVLVALVETTLAALTESFRDRVKKPFALEELLRAHETSCAFVSSVARAIRTTTTTTTTTTVDLVLDDMTTSSELADRVLTAVLAPYQSIFRDYAALAGDALSQRLASLVPRFSPSVEERKDKDDEDEAFASATGEENVLEAYALRVEDVSAALWAAVEDSVRVCYAFSAGALFPDAVRVVALAVEQLTQRLSAAMPVIRQTLGIGTGSKSDDQRTTDWGRFHATLALLRACGTLERDLAGVESRLSVRMREQVQRLYAEPTSDAMGSSSKTSPQATTRKHLLQRRRSGSLHVGMSKSGVSLSALALEPSRVATSAVLKWLQDDPEKEKLLTSFVQDLMMPPALNHHETKLFAQAHASLSRYTRHVQTLVYESVFAPIAHVLQSVPAHACWIQRPDESLGDLPTFSTLPQEYITVVADLLLSLLPQLEPFAESASLPKAAAASYNAHKVCTREWATLAQVLRLSPRERDACEGIFELSSSLSEGGDDDDQDDGETSEAATFVDLWTSAVASGTTAALVMAVLKIPSLSPLGAQQLEADLRYFQNVLNALSGGASDRNFLILGLQHGLAVPLSEYPQFVETLRSEHATGDDSDAPADRVVVLRLHEALLTKRLHHDEAPTPPAASTPDAGSTVQFY